MAAKSYTVEETLEIAQIACIMSSDGRMDELYYTKGKDLGFMAVAEMMGQFAIDFFEDYKDFDWDNNGHDGLDDEIEKWFERKSKESNK